MRSRLPAVVALALGARFSAAAPPDAGTIVAHMKAALEPARASTRKLTVVVTSKDGASAEWTAGQARKKLPDGNRILTALLSPDSVRGMALLVQERPGQPQRQWFYVPAVRRVRELVPVESQQAFLNTDFTYADLGFVGRPETTRLLGSETRDGARAYRIEAVPHERWYYSRIATWVNAESWLPVRREFYDPAGLKWKVETWTEVTQIDGVPIPLRVRMDDVRQGGSSELRVSDVLWDRDIPADLFEPANLPRAAEAPLWMAR